MQQKTTEKTGMYTYGFIFTHETRETGGLLTAISKHVYSLFSITGGLLAAISEHVAFHTSNLQTDYAL